VADFDDFLFCFRGHPSCMLMPSALAACESAGGSGKDLLTAFVVGCEIGGKVGGVIGRQLNDKGWHGTGIIGPLGCAAAAAKALHLDRDQTANALGIAASSAAGLRVNFGSMTKSYHAGHAAMAGVLAAQLAGEGFDASSVALEGDDGFAKLFGNVQKFRHRYETAEISMLK
jgi:2-methylcitrate dehydratase PrpD